MERIRRQLQSWYESFEVPGRAAWLLFAVPGLYQTWLVCRAVGARFGYGYDLEWMESGMLTQALRISQGHPPYEAPSVDFIAHLYAPLYSIVVAALSPIFGVTYQVGRAVSILSLVALAALLVYAASHESDADRRFVPLVAASVGMGVLALGYPFTDGWYDLVRVDTLMCATVVGGLVGLRADPVGDGPAVPFVYPRTALWAAILAMAFFVKQTAIFFVAAGGATLLLVEWRAVPSYVVSGGVVGFGGLGILQWWTEGWAWTYLYAYHQHHGSSSARFWGAFETIWEFAPPLWILVGAASLFALLRVLFVDGEHRSAKGLLYWSWVLGVAVVAGGVGMSTQWAAVNAYMPAIVMLAFTTTTAIVAIAQWARRPSPKLQHAVLATLLTLLGVFLWSRTWSPSEYRPTQAAADRGREIVRILRDADGPVLAPYFPWYAHLAGKEVQVHQMGIKDIRSTRGHPCDEKKGFARRICPELEVRASKIAGLDEALESVEYGAVMIGRKSRLRAHMEEYRCASPCAIPAPTPPTGYPPRGVVVFEPEVPSPNPERGRLLFDDFESSRLPDWEITGRAWGSGPVTAPPRAQHPVGGYLGGRFMDSFHGGDASTGTALSPPFTLEHPRMHLRVGGGRDERDLRVELRDETGEVIRSATGRNSETLRSVVWQLDDRVGERLRIALVDASSEGWGHLLVDGIYTTE